MALVKSRAGRIGLFVANPMIAKLDKIEEHDDTKVTAKGITVKTIFLMLLTLVGIALFFITNDMIPETNFEVNDMKINLIEAGIVLGGVLVSIFFSLIAFKWVRLAGILGILYSLIQGYALAFLFHIFGEEYVYPAIFALFITVAIVLLMLFMYRAKIVKVDKKFTSIVLITILTGVILAIIYFILSMIPALDSFIAYIQENSVIYIIVGLVSIIVSALFLLIDFEVLNRALIGGMPKKYEWLAAYGLSFSVINVYYRVLDLFFTATNDK